MQQCGGSNTLIAFGPWTLLEEELMVYRFYSSPKMERFRVVPFGFLRSPLSQLGLVCRILIPEAAGGTQLRHGALAPE
jgi:hypothetical protein